MIAAEDTRITGILLEHFAIKTPMMSLQKYNESQRCQQILQRIQSGQDIALVCDAGTPNISDPGAYLIQFLRQNSISIIPIPGPTSIAALLSISGILANTFYFGGFFPRTESAYQLNMPTWRTLQCPLVFFESAKRIKRSLGWLYRDYPALQVCIGKELTKPYEQVFVGPLHEIMSQKEWAFTLKGEFSIIINDLNPTRDCGKTQEWLNQFTDLGLTLGQSLAIGKKLDIPKNMIKTHYYSGGDSHD